MFWYITCRS